MSFWRRDSMTDEKDNAAVPFDQWKDELEIRASEYKPNPTVPLLMLGIIAAAFAFDFFRGSNGKA